MQRPISYFLRDGCKDHHVCLARQRGFTLLEFVVVILIISILAVSIDFTPSDHTVELRAQAEQLSSDIRFVQSLSMTRGERFRINFFSNKYTMTDRQAVTPFPHPATNLNDILLKDNITLSVNGAITNDYLVFDGQGKPYVTDALPGTALGSAGEITLTRDTETVVISVSPETGRVVIL